MHIIAYLKSTMSIHMSENSDQIAYILQQILDKLTEMSYSLEGIATNVAQSTGVYNVDDVVSRIDQVSSDVGGTMRYSLTDIHSALEGIDSNLFEINLAIKLRE